MLKQQLIARTRSIRSLLLLLGLQLVSPAVASAEISLSMFYSTAQNAYQWDLYNSGSAMIIGVTSPNGTEDFGYFDTFQELNSDIAGEWAVTTNEGDFTFQLDPIDESDFVVPQITGPASGQTFQSGDFIPFEFSASGVAFTSRGYYSNPDLMADFEPGGFIATLNPGVESAVFRMFAIGFNLTEAYAVDDPEGLFITDVEIGGETSPVSVNIVSAIPEPAGPLALLTLVGIGTCARRRR